LNRSATIPVVPSPSRDVVPDRRVTRVAASLLVLAAIGVVVPVLLAHRYGALDIPRSDGWSYTRTLFVWYDTGRWDFNNWVSMTLVGQVFLAVPVLAAFGKSVLALNLAFACLGFVGLVGCWLLGRRCGLTDAHSLLVTVAAAGTPIWGALVPTFMTDVPAFVFAMLALLLAVHALRRPAPSMPLLAASIATAFVGVSIRQYGAVPLLAIFAVAAWQLRATRDRRAVRILAGLAVATVVGLVVLFAWWRGVPHAKDLAPSMPTTSSLKSAYLNGAGFLRLAGITLVPVVLLANPRAIVRRALRTDRVLTLWVVLAAGFVMLTGYVPKRPFVGNYFARRGVLGDDIILPGVRPLIMPNWAFDVLVAIGTVSALVIVCATVPWLVETRDAVRARRVPGGDPAVALPGLTVAGFAVAYELAMATGLPIFDRYALPALPLIGVLLLGSAERRRAHDVPEGDAGPARAARTHATLAAGGMVLLVLIGAAYTAESASFDGTRWKVGEMAVARGYTHVQVDAGYEWVGWFRGDGPLTADTEAERKRLRAGYYQGLCVSILVDADKTPPGPVASADSSAPTRPSAPFVAFRNERACSAAPDSTGP
jgi:hypothetical protein